MSDFDFLAWTALIMGVSTAAVLLLGKVLDPMSARFGRWWGARLQRRLADRLRRGEDRYFEERRAIEAAIVRHDLTEQRRQWRFPAMHVLVGMIGAAILAVLAVRDLVAPAMHQSVPGWATANVAPVLFFAIAAQSLLEWWFSPRETVA